MSTLLIIGSGDRAGYDPTPQAVREAAHARDAALEAAGALVAVAGKPVQVRNPDAAGVTTSERPFLSSPLPIAGFAVVEAADRDEAVRLASGVPRAVAHGVVEVWPLETTDGGGACPRSAGPC